ncbi:MAG TPA: prolyl oligopeptidase family serine peptidase [Dyella sp.]|uniref:prolyl oligopeptidase family serine peptidase n=1 Tax=Dyella sp. TaxID=1869338 RepID=UPI002D767135|nr:prolyl oligopeptidase family serine peptidase [Dyella sp.]HET6553951.1 prolyl oligopeptidase family serine peptidase [Dyella sp.]
MRCPRLVPLVLAGLLAGSAIAQLAPPPAPPQRPVQDTYFGTTLTDPYRYMEKVDDPQVIDWLKAEGRYTGAVLGSVPGRAALLKSVSQMSGSFAIVSQVQRMNGVLFYEERAEGSDNFDLWTRAADGRARKLIDVAALRASHGGRPYAINYFSPSPDGAKVAVGISEGGSEDASLYVYDVASGKQVAGPLELARFGVTGWTDDGQKLFVMQQAKQPPGAPEKDKFLNVRNVVWDMTSAPVALLGGNVPGKVKLPPEMFPFLLTRPGASTAVTEVQNGVQNELALWTVAASRAADPTAPWVSLASADDGITAVDMVGDRIFLLSHKDAPTFKVLALKAGEPLSSAKTLVAAQPGRLIEGIAAAADGVYVYARRGVYSELFKVPLEGGAEQAVALPFKGSVAELSTDPRVLGLVFRLESWVTPPTIFAYSPDTKHLADLKLGRVPKNFDASRYVVAGLSAKARDGTAVPLSYVELKNAPHPQLLLLYAYGSYGMSQFPFFSPRWASVVSNDIGLAVCHVRGGGELGEAWRLGGKDANKPNTWRDLIACGEGLVSRGYTTKDKLFIMGGSAGGITMGRAMEERPDLFAGVIDMVPVSNTVRQEFFSNGVPNIPEFGTVKNQDGFRNLLAMDSYFNVSDKAQYPAVLITTGLNDPRVPSWEPAKLAARLRTTGSKAPVLLRVDEAAGHGIGSTRSQNDELYTDVITFIRWRGGMAGWQPQALPGGASAAGAGK